LHGDATVEAGRQTVTAAARLEGAADRPELHRNPFWEGVMPVPISCVTAPPESAIPRDPANFDEQWTAWLAKCAARDRVVRGRMAVVLIIIVSALVVLYALLGH
jgi:hypothetical protein